MHETLHRDQAEPRVWGPEATSMNTKRICYNACAYAEGVLQPHKHVLVTTQTELRHQPDVASQACSSQQHNIHLNTPPITHAAKNRCMHFKQSIDCLSLSPLSQYETLEGHFKNKMRCNAQQQSTLKCVNNCITWRRGDGRGRGSTAFEPCDMPGETTEAIHSIIETSKNHRCQISRRAKRCGGCLGAERTYPEPGQRCKARGA
jgi:hypothetical protein